MYVGGGKGAMHEAIGLEFESLVGVNFLAFHGPLVPVVETRTNNSGLQSRIPGPVPKQR